MAGLSRGDVHMTRLGRPHGRVQAGSRPAVILQAPELAALSTVVVAPLSTSAHSSSFRPAIRVGNEATRVLADQLQATDATRIGKRVGRLSGEELKEVDRAVRRVLGLR